MRLALKFCTFDKGLSRLYTLCELRILFVAFGCVAVGLAEDAPSYRNGSGGGLSGKSNVLERNDCLPQHWSRRHCSMVFLASTAFWVMVVQS